PRRADLRLVAATNRDLDEAMKKGQFRQDLFYRVNTITIRLPALREHRDDIPLLAEHFLEEKATYGVKRLSRAALGALEAYSWPGNVRELLHAVERGVILAKGDEIQPEDLPPEVVGRGSATVSAPAPASAATLESMERQAIVATLRQVSGHRGKAAALLCIDPNNLYPKLLA